jgi:hypothetical protein
MFNLKTFARTVSFAIIVASMSACNSSSSDVEKISVTLSGLQQNPPVVGNRAGTGNIEINTETGEISGSIVVSNLTGTATATHIHDGDAGKNGGVVIELTQDATDSSKFNVPNGSELNTAQLERLLMAGLYVNVHTLQNSSGEVRGQIIPDNYTVARVTLSGAEEVPANTATTTGIAYITVKDGGDKVRAHMKVIDLDGATGAHIHAGTMGTNGDVVIGFVKDTTDTSMWSLPNNSKLSETSYDAFIKDGLYVNVHTPTFPAGEVRGQIKP